MILTAPAREEVVDWDAESQCFVDRPEPMTSWLNRALSKVYATEPLRDDIIEPRLVIGLDVRTELLKEVQRAFLLDNEPTMIYGAKVEVDPKLAVPFEIHWKTRRELVEESTLQFLAERHQVPSWMSRSL